MAKVAAMERDAEGSMAIVGAGALGGYVGIRLAHAGRDVRFLLRSDLDAARAGGLRLEFADAPPMHVEKPRVFASTGEMGVVDWVFIALKTTQRAALRELLPPLLGPRTVLITLQNGLGNVEFLQAAFPGQPVVGAVCQIGATRVGPAHIRSFVPGGGSIQVAAANAPEATVQAVADALNRAGIATRAQPRLQEILWRKLMWNVPFNGLSIAAGGVETSEIVNDPRLAENALQLMRELRLAALTLELPIEAEFPQKLMDFTRRMPPYSPSSLIDFRLGRELEVQAIFGEPLRQAAAAGVETPRLSLLNALLNTVNTRLGARQG